MFKQFGLKARFSPAAIFVSKQDFHSDLLVSKQDFFSNFKVVWIGIVGKMLILPKKIDKWDSPVMFEGLGGK